MSTGGTGPRLLVHAGSFALLDARGDITGARGRTPDGLFTRDARHLSRWRLTVDGVAPVLLSAPALSDGDGDDNGGPVVLAPEATRDEPADVLVLRHQALYEGQLSERLTVTSNVAHETAVTVALEADADFADQFELRSDRRTYRKPGARHEVREVAGGVVFAYHRDEWHAETTVSAVPAPDEVGGGDGTARTLVWRLTLPAHGTTDVTLTAGARPHAAPDPTRSPSGPAEAERWIRDEQAEFRRDDLHEDPHDGRDDRHEDPHDGRNAGRDNGRDVARNAGRDVGRDNGRDVAPNAGRDGEDAVPGLAAACARGVADLAGLLVPATGPDGEPVQVPGAGVPWFLALFGRDSLLTSYFALPYRPVLARGTLLALAAAQATAVEPERVAAPGKIVHEVRHGELASFGQVPYGRYYGSVDSTPLFLVLLHAYTETTGDRAAARRLEPHARAAVEWLTAHGGLDDHGYLVYQADAAGLLNQNWKDSAGAVCFPDGTPLTGAVAVAEAQGYAYDALRRTAALARSVWGDAAWADRLDALARELRERFERDFLGTSTGFPAFALDGTRRSSEVLASDAGHLLWSGILGRDVARTVADRLLDADFFSGWGIRTLAAGQAPYHPMSYHRGSVWPHDNAVVALGMGRYGLREQARVVAGGLLDAAAATGHRLPELFSGHRRGAPALPAPVPYPHSNSPQAWAAATPLALLTAVRFRRPGS